MGVRSAAVLLVTVAACGSTLTLASGDPDAADAAAIVDPACRSVSTETSRDQLPSGSCVSGADCRFQVPPHECGPGVHFKAAEPNQYECTCPMGDWVCTIIGGGFGVLLCPDFDAGMEAGQVDAADATAPRDASSDADGSSDAGPCRLVGQSCVGECDPTCTNFGTLANLDRNCLENRGLLMGCSGGGAGYLCEIIPESGCVTRPLPEGGVEVYQTPGWRSSRVNSFLSGLSGCSSAVATRVRDMTICPADPPKDAATE
jgi:hypothetical protein